MDSNLIATEEMKQLHIWKTYIFCCERNAMLAHSDVSYAMPDPQNAPRAFCFVANENLWLCIAFSWLQSVKWLWSFSGFEPNSHTNCKSKAWSMVLLLALKNTSSICFNWTLHIVTKRLSQGTYILKAR